MNVHDSIVGPGPQSQYLHQLNAQLARRDAEFAQHKAGLRADAPDPGAHPLIKGIADHFVETLRSMRVDDVDANTGIAFERELQHVYTEVLREEMPRRSALELFPIDGGIQPGAQTYKISRVYHSGRAAVHRSGQPVPKVDVGRGEHIQQIQHYVLGDAFDIFEAFTFGKVNLSRAAEGLRAMRDGLADFANQASWFGIESAGIYGAINYPWVPKYVESVGLNDDTADPRDILLALHRIANFPADTHKNVPSPNTMAMGHKLYNYLATRQVGTDNTRTILEVFKEQSPFINRIEPCEELTAAGPGDTDVIFVTRLDRLGISNVLPNTFTPVPMFQRLFDMENAAYTTHGGVLMRSPIHSLVAYVEGPAFA